MPPYMLSLARVSPKVVITPRVRKSHLHKKPKKLKKPSRETEQKKIKLKLEKILRKTGQFYRKYSFAKMVYVFYYLLAQTA